MCFVAYENHKSFAELVNCPESDMSHKSRSQSKKKKINRFPPKSVPRLNISLSRGLGPAVTCLYCCLIALS